MKSYKIKSLVYFACFLAAAVFYYNFEKEVNLQQEILTANVAETEFEDAEKHTGQSEVKEVK
ncbi:Hypothetical protein I595_1991 [Croceitalea dokdonensis DOKDO 023]|uniref:Uncharacterized protein n=1 Tax=Croceitalea dokdonensis DOKDO 023 TaxID=1300341 RepID=A0A0P7AWB4_9FLAO|nr:hypothetical protein [Croceitalea dokdonensis]KPM32339.1 Hypothetical protein I595_1991 [Croceitalea dokdonensis DOKDO 023]